MTGVQIQGLTKRFGDEVVAVDDLDITIAPGELLVLLGPSGCGKSTILRSVAGLERPTTGRIRFGDRDVFDSGTGLDLEPRQRRLGMVFQNYALWPHMTVFDNIAFPLGDGRADRARRSVKVREVAELVECGHLLHRYPGELSGGQQQRIALARAIVAEPAVLLFDEPLSNLDARLRSDMRSVIRNLHRTLGFAGIYVTHDQEEGLTIGDRIAIMNAGQVVQLGAPADVFDDPATEWAADFMGMTNRLLMGPAPADDGCWRRRAGPLDTAATDVVRARPDDATIYPSTEALPDRGHVIVHDAVVRDRAFTGSNIDFTFELDGKPFIARVRGERATAIAAQPGDTVSITIPREKVRRYDPGSEPSPEQTEDEQLLPA